jgi:FlaG/FlaF family flagellin (archaellin)
MVAISVILAAVVGAFVLEVGDQEEAPPTATFSFDQEVRYYNYTGPDTNLTTVAVSHSGGDTLAISQVNIKVNGNRSVWGPIGKTDSQGDLYRPMPDHFEAATTNQPVTIESGDQWTINSYRGWPDERVKKKEIVPPYYGQYVEGSKTGYTFKGCAAHGVKDYVEDPSVRLAEKFGGGTVTNLLCTDRLSTGDELRAVWQSSSGGETQTLTKYRVTEDGAPPPGSL